MEDDSIWYSLIEEFVVTEDCFKNNDVSIIDNDGLQHYLDNKEYMIYLSQITAAIATGNTTIKIEQFEDFMNTEKNLMLPLVVKEVGDDFTAHAFYNQANSGTFGIHTDPVDVFIQCLAGVKHLEVEGYEMFLGPHEIAYVPANTPHRALNKEKALVVSYGIYDTETSSSIRKND